MNIAQIAHISGFQDQHHIRRIMVETSQGSVWLSMMEVVEPAKAAAKLAQIGLPLPPGKRRTAFFERLTSIEEYQPVHIIDQVGWHPNTFALGDGTQILPDEAEPLRSLYQQQPYKWSVAGTSKGWKKAVAKPLTGQVIPMFVIMLAFAPAIMKFIPCWINPGFELVGGGGIGKSTLLKLAASVYGGIGDDGGSRFWETWNTTNAGVETLLEGHTNCLLILDELNALTAGGTTAAKRQAYSGMLFNLSFGIEKTRHNDKRNVQRQICYLSSSNTPMLQELSGGDPESVKAAADRLLTIRADAGFGIGVFSFVPDGFDNSRQLIDSVMDGARGNHGVAIRAYLQRLVQEVSDDPDVLTGRLKAWTREFEKRALSGADSGSQVRTASLFALIYAAGKLAQHYVVLPKRWSCGEAVLACYRKHIQDKSTALGGAVDRIQAYASLPGVIVCKGATKISQETFRDSAGLMIGKGIERELVVHPEALRERISDGLSLVKALKAVGVIEGDPGTYQTKRTIGGKSIRVYAFKIKS